MQDYSNDITSSVKALQAGGIILYPTDTIWGLGCDATNEQSIEKIFGIKHRSRSKSMIILAKNAEWVRQYVQNPSPVLLAAINEAKEPTTGIFGEAIGLPANLTGQNKSIAIRIPSDHFCQQLLSAFGKPIVSTSANISEHEFPQNFSEIDPVLLEKVDYTVFYRRDDNTRKKPSHILRLNSEGKIEKIR